MGSRILIITEANKTVATGHLFESAELAKQLIASGHTVVVLVNDDAESELKAKLPLYNEYRKDVDYGYDTISDFVNNGQYSVVVTDLREISNNWIHRFKSEHDIPLICIDEWGHRRLDCDAIINPMIDAYYWEYGETEAKLYCGHDYLILSSALRQYHEREKKINRTLKRICISMGGVDRAGTTLKLLDWIRYNSKKLGKQKWDIVLGAGFSLKDELERSVDLMDKYENPKEKTINLHYNPKNIYELFYQADVVFCAGGNTLHEVACIGTPAIVIPSMPHEKRNGEEFERRGFGMCLPMAEQIQPDAISRAVKTMQPERVRAEMHKKGRSIVDGGGLGRNLHVLEQGMV